MKSSIRILIAAVIAFTWFMIGGLAVAEQDSPPVQGSEAKAATDQNETGYWMTSSSHKRHNKTFRYYKNSIGHFCGPNDGIPCKLCGGGAIQSFGTTNTVTRAQATDVPTGQTTPTGKTIYEGPRGGHYHYSSSGKKVYERRK